MWVQSLGCSQLEELVVPLEEGITTHSSILSWRIPWTEEPGGLQLIGSQKVGHDYSNLVCTHAQLLNTDNY